VQLWPCPPKPVFSQKIVFLHGIACTHQVWAPLSAQLSKKIDVYAPDLRFHGESRPNTPNGEGFSIRDYALDLLETLAQSRFYPAWLVGHSMGARVAVAAASLNFEGVKGLVLVDHPLLVSSEECISFRNRFREFLKDLPLRFPSLDLAMVHLQEHCPDPSSIGILSQSYLQKTNGEMELQFDKDAILKTFDALPSFPFAESLHLLGRRKKPVLIVRGGQSPFWSAEDWEKSKQNFGAYPSFKFIEVKTAGHGLPFEKEALFLKEVLSFIREIPPGRWVCQ